MAVSVRSDGPDDHLFFGINGDGCCDCRGCPSCQKPLIEKYVKGTDRQVLRECDRAIAEDDVWKRDYFIDKMEGRIMCTNCFDFWRMRNGQTGHGQKTWWTLPAHDCKNMTGRTFMGNAEVEASSDGQSSQGLAPQQQQQQQVARTSLSASSQPSPPARDRRRRAKDDWKELKEMLETVDSKLDDISDSNHMICVAIDNAKDVNAEGQNVMMNHSNELLLRNQELLRCNNQMLYCMREFGFSSQEESTSMTEYLRSLTEGLSHLCKQGKAHHETKLEQAKKQTDILHRIGNDLRAIGEDCTVLRATVADGTAAVQALQEVRTHLHSALIQVKELQDRQQGEAQQVMTPQGLSQPGMTEQVEWLKVIAEHLLKIEADTTSINGTMYQRLFQPGMLLNTIIGHLGSIGQSNGQIVTYVSELNRYQQEAFALLMQKLARFQESCRGLGNSKLVLNILIICG